MTLASPTNTTSADGAPAWMEHLRCPRCHGALVRDGSGLHCRPCRIDFPVVDGVPVLIDEQQSVFRIADFTGKHDTFFARESFARRTFFACLPNMSVNRVAPANYRVFASLLRETSSRPRVLILGGSILGTGMREFRGRTDIEFVDSDVAFGPLTKLVCDAHGLPFADGSIDGIVAQAVLEHVADPTRVVAEMHRVLSPRGLVYAETPFLQPAHSTPYDFQRYTHIGYRRLFHAFECLELGPVGGPGQALGHLWESFLMAFFRTKVLRAPLLAFARFSGFWWKYFDRFLNRNHDAMHGAFGLYILARRAERTLDDREVVAECRKYE